MASFLAVFGRVDAGGNLYNHLVMESLSYHNPNLDAVFGALAAPTRRAILAKL